MASFEVDEPSSPNHNPSQQTQPKNNSTRTIFNTTNGATAAPTKLPIPSQMTRVISKGQRNRKNVRDFRKKREDPSAWKGRIGAHIEVDSIEIKQLYEKIINVFDDVWNIVQHFDVIHMSQQITNPTDDVMLSDVSDTEGKTKEAIPADYDVTSTQIFIFSFGPVVFWNFPDADSERDWMKKNILNSFPGCCGEHLDERTTESAYDDIMFKYGDTAKMRQDTVVLKTSEAGEKMAVSFALAQSTLLSVYEWDLECSIERNSDLPEELANTGKIKMTGAELYKEMGSIFLIKHALNLDSNIQDTPEEFWEDDRFEDVFKKTLIYFEIEKRLRLVNDRLSMIQDLHQVLREQEENRHEVFLEWVIIWLIIIEVIFEFLSPLYYHLFYRDDDDDDEFRPQLYSRLGIWTGIIKE